MNCNKTEKRELILLVEDDYESAQAMKTMLIKRKMRVEIAESAEKALECFDPAKHDAIVADIRLGEISGVDLLRKIREKLPDFPVILLTGYDSVGSAIQAIRLGANDYILKPLSSIDDLFIPLKRAIRDHNALLRNSELEKEREHTQNLLKAAYERSRFLCAHIAKITEEEKNKLARELHDQAGQKIAALCLGLNYIRDHVHPSVSDDVQSRLNTTIQETDELRILIADIMAQLRPKWLDQSGLFAALENYCNTLRGNLNEITIRLKGSHIKPRLHSCAEIGLFRIVQEAITNITKHAKAANISLNLSQDNEKVRLEVSDDGIGFDRNLLSKDSKHGWGLMIMEERAFAVGGQLFINSTPEKGTSIVVEIKRDQQQKASL